MRSAIRAVATAPRHLPARRRFAVLSAIAILATPQLGGQARDSLSLATIHNEGLERSQVMETLSWLTDVFGGRLTSAPAMLSAADWAEQRLRSWAISRVYRERWGPPWPGWTNELLWVRAVAPTPFQITAIASPWSPGTRGVVRGPAMLVTDLASEADFARYTGKLRNAFVMIAEPPPVSPPRFEPLASRRTTEELLGLESIDPEKVELEQDSAQIAARARMAAVAAARRAFTKRRLRFFADEGVAALINVGRGFGGTVFVSTTGLEWPEPLDPPPLPVLTFSSEHYGRIARVLRKGLAVTVEAEVRNTLAPARDSAFTLLAEIPGTDRRDEVVMLGAHFDSYHIGTGATDNAANVATMMEAMRILRATGVPLRRTVRLALWTGEEQGLYGSRAYVRRHFVDSAGKPLPESGRLAAYYNLDNGAGAIRGIHIDQRIQRSRTTDSLFRSWAQLLPRDLDFHTISARGTGATDHVSFYSKGLPGFQFVQDWLEYFALSHHSTSDTYERVLPDDVKKNAVTVASWVYLTANHATLLPRMRVEQSP